MKQICKEGELLHYLDDYLTLCRVKTAEARESGRRGYEWFPNLAGFARMLGVSVDTLKKVNAHWPEQYGAMLAILEDEALNTEKSATILNTYLKEHLGFGEKREGDAMISAGRVKVVFEHDIAEDGK